MVMDGMIEPMELGHLPCKKVAYEDYVVVRGLGKWGKKHWGHHVVDVVARLVAVLEPEDLRGGNVRKGRGLPRGFREGGNANAFLAEPLAASPRQDPCVKSPGKQNQ